MLNEKQIREAARLLDHLEEVQHLLKEGNCVAITMGVNGIFAHYGQGDIKLPDAIKDAVQALLKEYLHGVEDQLRQNGCLVCRENKI